MSFAIVTRPADEKPPQVVVLFDARQEAEEVARGMRDRGLSVTVEPAPPHAQRRS